MTHGADGAGSVGAVNAIDGTAEIHRAGAKRITGTARHVARQVVAVQRTLVRQGLAREPDGEGAYRFLCTGDIASFRELGTRFLQMPLGDVERVDIAAS